MLNEEKKIGGGENSNSPENVVPTGGDKPEVKPNEPITQEDKTPVGSGGKPKEDLIKKQQEQIESLTAGINATRNEAKEYRNKTKELEEKVVQNNETISKLKDVFVPPEPPENTVPQEGLTKEEMEAFYEQKREEERIESEKTKRVKLVQADIEASAKKWDGKDGRPEYDDKEVLKWQEENNQGHLMPSQAFDIMKRNEIDDYNFKQRMKGHKPAPNVEQPSSQPDEHKVPEIKIETEEETRDAVREAIKNANAEI